MARYKTHGEWGGNAKHGSFYIQIADCIDTTNGVVYQDGAYRVVDAGNGMKPVKGKGGTTPFFGDMAWMGAESLARDLALNERYSQ